MMTKSQLRQKVFFSISICSLCKKTPNTALLSFLKQSSRSSFCKVFKSKNQQKAQSGLLSFRNFESPRKIGASFVFDAFLSKTKKSVVFLLAICISIIYSFNSCSNSQPDKTTIDNNTMYERKSENQNKTEPHKENNTNNVLNENDAQAETDKDNHTEIDVSSETKVNKEKEYSLQSQLKNAKKSNKAVFLVVTVPDIPDTEKALNIAKGANNLYEDAIVLQMNRNDVANSELIREWQLTDAPLPLILVISSNGMLTGGYILAQATPENIAALVPSPNLEKAIEAISNNKYAIAVFSRSSFSDKQEVLRACKDVVEKLNNEAVIIEVDMDDKKETGFMNQLRIDRNSKSSITMIMNKQGQIAGISRGVPEVEKMVIAARTPVRAGCGPGMGPANCGR